MRGPDAVAVPAIRRRTTRGDPCEAAFVAAFTLATTERVTVVSHVAAVWLIFVMWVSWGGWPRVRVGGESGWWIE